MLFLAIKVRQLDAFLNLLVIPQFSQIFQIPEANIAKEIYVYKI